jgi:hypothetical protein
MDWQVVEIEDTPECRISHPMTKEERCWAAVDVPVREFA